MSRRATLLASHFATHRVPRRTLAAGVLRAAGVLTMAALSVPACGEPAATPATSAPVAALPAATTATTAETPAVPAPAPIPRISPAELQAQAAQADRPLLEQVLTQCNTDITTLESDMAALQSSIQSRAGGLFRNALEGGPNTSTGMQAEVQQLSTKLEDLKQELAALKEKHAIYLAELAKRPL